MKYRITQMTKNESGAYNESGDILPDLLNGGECPQDMDEMLSWLADEGYKPTGGFIGWGAVVRHEDDGTLLSIMDEDE